MAIHLVTGHAGAEHVTGADQGSFNIGVIGDGQYVLPRGKKFAAGIYSNNIVRVADGDLVMQGRHIRQKEKSYEECVFDNGTQGMLRNDLICVRYTKDDSTGAEKAELVVLKGQEAVTNPTDPTPTTGDITENGDALVNEMPLYRVPFVGLTMQDPVQLFSVVDDYSTFATNVRNQVEEINSTLSSLGSNVDDVNNAVEALTKTIQNDKKIIDQNKNSIDEIKTKSAETENTLDSVKTTVENIKSGTETVQKAVNADTAESASMAKEADESTKLKNSVKVGKADFDGSKDITLKDMGVYEIIMQTVEPTVIEDNTIVFVYEE